MSRRPFAERPASHPWLGALLALWVALLSVAVGSAPAAALSTPPATAAIYAYDLSAPVAHGTSRSLPPALLVTAPVRGGSATAEETSAVQRDFSVAAEGGSRIAANQAAGNAARDVLAAAHPGSLIEQSLTTTAGVRRLDILTQSRLAIEAKVGRTSLTATTRSQIAKDSLLLRNGQVSDVEWVFSRSGVTGQVGPTGPLADALSKAGIPWSLAP